MKVKMTPLLICLLCAGPFPVVSVIEAGSDSLIFTGDLYVRDPFVVPDPGSRLTLPFFRTMVGTAGDSNPSTDASW